MVGSIPITPTRGSMQLRAYTCFSAEYSQYGQQFFQLRQVFGADLRFDALLRLHP